MVVSEEVQPQVEFLSADSPRVEKTKLVKETLNHKSGIQKMENGSVVEEMNGVKNPDEGKDGTKNSDNEVVGEQTNLGATTPKQENNGVENSENTVVGEEKNVGVKTSDQEGSDIKRSENEVVGEETKPGPENSSGENDTSGNKNKGTENNASANTENIGEKDTPPKQTVGNEQAGSNNDDQQLEKVSGKTENLANDMNDQKEEKQTNSSSSSMDIEASKNDDQNKIVGKVSGKAETLANDMNDQKEEKPTSSPSYPNYSMDIERNTSERKKRKKYIIEGAVNDNKRCRISGNAPEEQHLEGENYKAKLGVWSQKKGSGNFADAFTMHYYHTKTAEYVCSLHHKDTDHVEEGIPSAGKKTTTQSACKKMYEHLILTVGKVKHYKEAENGIVSGYKAKLGEWTQKRGRGNFNDNFKVDYECTRDGEYEATIVYKPTGFSVKGAPTRGKRPSEWSACEVMFKYLVKRFDSLPVGAGPALRFEALLGDKILDHCLALRYYKECGEDTAKLHMCIASRSNNRRLRERMTSCGLKPTGQEVLDASRVEQWVWQMHQRANFEIFRTMELIEPLLK